MKKFSEDVVKVLCNRGLACAFVGDFAGAFDNFREAVGREPGLVGTHPFCRAASKVPSADIFEHWLEVLGIVHKIQKLCQPSQAPKAVFHYTGLNTLKKLVEGEKFRLYNADYMDDPEEGKSFWNIVKKISGRDFREEIYSGESEESLSPAYVGSFVRMKDEEKEDDAKDGELFLWRTYGKNAGVEAAGVCLHFDISKFSETPPLEIGLMEPSECIYEVVYENEINLSENEDRRAGDPRTRARDLWVRDLRDRLGELTQELIYITEKNWKSPAEKKDTLRLVGESLDRVSFLFKGSHYREERELRIVQVPYTVNLELSNEQTVEGGSEVDNRKADAAHQPPRIYLEVQNLDLKGVTLGPMTQDALEWTHWLKWRKSDLKIHHSKIRYGKKTR